MINQSKSDFDNREQIFDRADSTPKIPNKK